jgi:hypothetical protein
MVPAIRRGRKTGEDTGSLGGNRRADRRHRPSAPTRALMVFLRAEARSLSRSQHAIDYPRAFFRVMRSQLAC